MIETDIPLFVTQVRLVSAYHGLLKCNQRRVADHPALYQYMLQVLMLLAVRETVSLDHIKRGYCSIRALNPTEIVPKGPELSWAR